MIGAGAGSGIGRRIGAAAERLAARAMIRPRSPTADLYLVNACGGWIGPDRPVARLGPGVFASAETLVVVRNWGRAEALPRRRRVIWLIDDDIEAACADRSLRPGQRLKLALFERRQGRRLLAAGAEVAVSSAALAERYRGRARVHLLRPHWSEPLAGLAHHAEAGPVRIGFLGSAVHGGDLAFLLPVLRELLDRHPEAELHLAANHRLGALAGHPRLRPIRETSWQAYRASLGARRLHIALYPLRETPVNRARSVNKIIEHGVAGAAGVYSAGWPEAARVARRGAGLVLPERAGAWAEAVSGLIRDAAARRALAARGRALAADLNHPALLQDFWRHGFALGPPNLIN
ncbi:hypothetical protein LNKW23_00250 [Paralimibaculum aggregatum]|uniref:Glycosyltransferase n=1 Tax=Paralimibaculum aggregatum TaxID=3036245 RepID=A0ABQ6LJ59_9RHOB|nr:hypothetical protein [Limibaculum sp. NKW23]GMG80813.1 hypothetical protein LNKW23_00250 [Limibaculum sp. NKW23]